ncbi:MAG TPA: proline racemase family protein [Pirellulaceae bacterium]|nr:proline racemase family protein [Pirellulaceae bacterium]
MPKTFTRISVIDSHTGGEPTRVILAGGPDLGTAPLAQRLPLLRDSHDHFRRATVNEPRGSDLIVGALLCEPVDPTCIAGVIFYNNVGYLGMCGHGTIGLIATLGHIGRVVAGSHRLETPVGIVPVEYDGAHTVTLENVASYRWKSQVAVDVPGIGNIRGDIAWGGNWFFLVSDHGQELKLANVEILTDFTWRIRQALAANGITAPDGAALDHIELFGPPHDPRNDSRNFVLCPGKAYDRSPCGTGTSAKLACLVADGKLQPGEVWRQESITGSVFRGEVRIDGDQIYPSITGEAFVTAETTLILDSRDPLTTGFSP